MYLLYALGILWLFLLGGCLSTAFPKKWTYIALLFAVTMFLLATYVFYSGI